MARDDYDDLDLLKAIRICAIKSVQKRDADYLLRYIFRWYSREFHTELEKVEDIPLEKVLEHFFECHYESMTDEERQEEIALLVESRTERLAREAKEEADKQADDEFLRQVANEAKEAAAKIGHTPLDKKVEPSERPIYIPAPVMGEVLPTQFAEVAAKADPKLKEIPPNIKMTFISEEEMEGLESWDLLGPVDKDK